MVIPSIYRERPPSNTITNAATSVATSPVGHVASGAPDTAAPRKSKRPFTVPSGAPDPTPP